MFIEPDTRKIFPRKLGIKLEQIILEKGEFEHFWSDLIELTIILYHLSKEQKLFEGFQTLSAVFHSVNRLQDLFAEHYSTLSCGKINLPQNGICLLLKTNI